MPGADVPRGPGGPPPGGTSSAIGHAPTQAVDRAALEGAPTQAIAVPSLATAPTEAIPVSALPVPAPAVTGVVPSAPAFAPPAGIAAAPAPRSALRVTALVAAGLLLLVALAGVLLVGRSRVAGLGTAGKLHPVDGAFASLTKEQIRERIDAGVHHVLHESTSEGVTTWTIDTVVPGRTGSVKLYRYPDVAQAERALEALHAGQTATRDGKAVLQVTLPSVGAAETLLARITR